MASRTIKRVLFLSSYNLNRPGGVQSHIQALSAGLRELGIATSTISLASLPLTAGAKMPRATRGAGHKLPPIFLYVAAKLIVGTIATVSLLTKHTDAIFFQDPLIFNALFPLAKLLRKKTSLTVHSYLTYESLAEEYVTKGSKGERYLWSQEEKAYRMAPIIVTVDTRIKNFIVENFPRVSARKIHVFSNFLDVKRFSPATEKESRVLRKSHDLPIDRFVILCPRVLTKKNGVEFAIRAIAELSPRERAGVLLVLAGDGAERKNIEDLVNKYSLNGAVKIFGTVPNWLMPDLYRASDAVVIPSIRIAGMEEATSISALEAMACGLPVVASRIGGLAELITDHRNGLLVEQKNPKAIAKAFLDIQGEAGARLGKAARQYVTAHHAHTKRAQEFFTLIQ